MRMLPSNVDAKPTKTIKIKIDIASIVHAVLATIRLFLG